MKLEKPASIKRVDSRGVGPEIRITVQGRVWYMSPDDARAAFMGLAQYYTLSADIALELLYPVKKTKKARRKVG